jgi:hypothetical protein
MAIDLLHSSLRELDRQQDWIVGLLEDRLSAEATLIAESLGYRFHV